MRLSLLSDDNDVAELLITKALELMSQAESAAAEDRKAAARRPNGDPGNGEGEAEAH